MRIHQVACSLLFVAVLFCLGARSASAQIPWTENFNDAGATARWITQDAPGSKTNPTPGGISGLVYNTAAGVLTNGVYPNYWIINNRNASDPATRTSQGQLRGANCGGAGTNNSLHITHPATDPGIVNRPFSDLLQEPVDGGDAYWPLSASSGSETVDNSASSDQIAYLNPTSAISTVGAKNLILSFDAFIYADLDLLGEQPLTSQSVVGSRDGGTTWVVIAEDLEQIWVQQGPNCASGWRRISLGLPAALYNSSNVIIGFRWRNRGLLGSIDARNFSPQAGGFNVDNLRIEEGADPVLASAQDIVSPCKNQTQTFSNTTNTLVRGITYRWDVSPTGNFTVVAGQANTNLVDNFGNLRLRFTANGTYNVVLRGTTATGQVLSPVSYTVTVANCPPDVDFTTAQISQVVCSTSPSPVNGSSTRIKFKNLTTSFPALGTYSWNIPDAVYVNGTNANSPEPEVEFSTVGAKTVSLTVTNAEGNATETKNNYIDVRDCQCQLITTPSNVTLLNENFQTNNTNALLTGGGWQFTDVAFNTGQFSGTHAWQVNSDYGPTSIGAGSVALCLALGTNTTPNQPMAITGAPQSNYLHVTAPGLTAGAGFCFTGSGQNALHFTTTPGQNIRARTPLLDATGLTNIQIDFQYLACDATNARVRYLNQTGTQIGATVNLATAATWTARNIAAAALDGQIFRVEFEWNTTSACGPAFSIDELLIRSVTGGAAGPATFVCPVPTTLCPGQTFTVPFNAAGTWAAGNNFLVQLSNASGSFGSPTQIGSLNNQVGTNLTGLNATVTIPAGLGAGTGYRIRVVGSAPQGGAQTNNDNGSNITVALRPAAKAVSGPTSVCVGSLAQTYSIPAGSTSSYTWGVTTGVEGTDWEIVSGQGTNSLQIRWITTSNRTLRVTESNSCGDRVNDLAVAVTGGPVIPDLQTGDVAVCINTSDTYAVPADPSIVTWEWTATNGTITGPNNTNSVNVTWAATPGPASLRLRAVNSCTETVRTYSVDISSGAPTGPFTLSGPANPCSNQIFNIIATPSTGFTYDWEVNGPGLGGFTDVEDAVTAGVATVQGSTNSGLLSIAFVNAGTYEVRLNVDNGCAPLNNAANGTYTVLAGPTPNITSNGGTAPITYCQADNTTNFAVTFSPSTGVVVDRWELSLDGGSTYTTVPSSATLTSLTVNDIGEERRYRVRYSAGLCTGLLTPALLIDFEPLPNPQASVPTEVQSGESITTATVTAPTTGTGPFEVYFRPTGGADTLKPFPVITSPGQTITLPAFSYTTSVDGTNFIYSLSMRDLGSPDRCETDVIGQTVLVRVLGLGAPVADKATYCTDELVRISFTAQGTYDPGNQFSVEVINNLGTTVATLANVTSPATLNLRAAGIRGGVYNLRVRSSSPVRSADGTISFTVLNLPDPVFELRDENGQARTVFLKVNDFVQVNGPFYTGTTSISDPNINCRWVIQHPLGNVVCEECDFLANCVLPPYTGPEGPRTYTAILVMDNQGCESSDTLLFEVRPDVTPIGLPTFFSPNKDGVNDVFQVDPTRFQSFTLEIFSRNGQMVFSTGLNGFKAWDGTFDGGGDAPEGVYFVHFKGVDQFGKSFDKTSTLTLLR
ncbi:MAG: gliding motility-associated C-terminal domain-containing protein [Sphingobacteriia bacterium]